jgi:hypothetical protein
MSVSKEDTLELAMSAQINFQNAVTMMPALYSNPIFQIAKGQLDEAVKNLETICDEAE